MVSVVTVAKHAGVSSATVSRVVAGRVPVSAETRARVMEAIEELGYRPNEAARSLRMGRGRAVALVTGDIEQGIHAALAKHVQSALEGLGFDLLLFNLGHREELLHHLLTRAPSLGLRGVLLSLPHDLDMTALAPLIRELADGGIEVVSVSQDLSRHGIASILHDDSGGAAAAVTHLLDRGRGPVAFVGRVAPSAVGRARFNGYRDALAGRGQALDPALVWDISQGYRADAGYQATTRALAQGLRFSSVLAASDELALGTMAAVIDHGLSVPDDVAVVGFGGLGWGAYARPAMTTVALDVGAVGQAVAEVFAVRDHVPHPVTHRVIPARLVLRQSA